MGENGHDQQEGVVCARDGCEVHQQAVGVVLGPSFGLGVVIAAALMDVGVFVALRFLDFDFLDLDLRLGVAGAAGSITCGFSTADACRGAILVFGFEYVSTTRAKASLFDGSLSRC